jgi:hypothetical protein
MKKFLCKQKLRFLLKTASAIPNCSVCRSQCLLSSRLMALVVISSVSEKISEKFIENVNKLSVNLGCPKFWAFTLVVLLLNFFISGQSRTDNIKLDYLRSIFLSFLHFCLCFHDAETESRNSRLESRKSVESRQK